MVIAPRRSLRLLEEGPDAKAGCVPLPAGRYAPSFMAIPGPFSRQAHRPVEGCAARPPHVGPSRGKCRGKRCGAGHWQIHCKGEFATRARPGGVAEGRCPAALRCTPPASSAQCCRPRRVAAPGDADRTHRAGVFDDATPTEEFRDVMVPDAPDLKAIRFFPHSTASPADRSEAGLAARLGVLPQCRSACLSMPPTPRKSG